MQPTPFLLALALAFPQEGPGTSSVVAPGAKLQQVWAEGTFTEGGALDKDGTILFSDIGNRIMRFDPKTGRPPYSANRAAGPTA